LKTNLQPLTANRCHSLTCVKMPAIYFCFDSDDFEEVLHLQLQHRRHAAACEPSVQPT
jgi:hypothetical protein